MHDPKLVKIVRAIEKRTELLQEHLDLVETSSKRIAHLCRNILTALHGLLELLKKGDL
jgi:hypothetical protein